ncbi:beta family protein [Aliarcobacter butzleri]|uniref:beta family protein n=1 Tax=Aliarcobacter butzleri TaxID=28197 RepID=UPI003B20E91A
MEKIKYIPFLKLKENEIFAVKELKDPFKSQILPLFDIPRKKDLDSSILQKSIDSGIKKINTHLNFLENFYIDTFDIDDSLHINGKHNYYYILKQCNNSAIPVTSIDRNVEQINSIELALKDELISNKVIALRFQKEDFINFQLIKDDIEDLLGDLINKFEKIDIIFDNRICSEKTIFLSNNIIKFIEDFAKIYKIRFITISGSVIDSTIGNIVKTQDSTLLHRYDMDIFNIVQKHFSKKYKIIFSDYGIISPNYSDIDIPGYMLRNIMTPKIIYSYDNKHFIIRGGALASHERGDEQYFDFAKIIVNKKFYRGENFSFGDKYLKEKSLEQGKKVTASSILKPTINAHMTYILSIV